MSGKRWVAAGIAGLVTALAVGWLFDAAMHKPWNPVSDLIVGVAAIGAVLFSMRGDRWRGAGRG